MLEKILDYAFKFEALVSEYDEWNRSVVMNDTRMQLLRANAPEDAASNQEFRQALDNLDSRSRQSKNILESAKEKLLNHANTETIEDAREKFLELQSVLGQYNQLRSQEYAEAVLEYAGEPLEANKVLSYARELTER